MTQTLWPRAAFAALALALGCDGSAPIVGPLPDATVDVPDAAPDRPSPEDVAAESGLDAPAESGLDAPAESGLDAPAEAAADAADVALDTRGPCRDNTDCGSNEFGLRACDTATGMCVECTATMRAACRPGFFCSAGNRCEAGCDEDADCAADGGSFRCDTARNTCVGCVRDDQCPAGEVCTGMTCVPGCNERQACPAGEACCAGACRRTQSDVSHCGACGAACSLAGAVAGCALGRCTVAACAAGLGDCDGNAANGCEVNTATSTAHCGSCGTTCPAGANAAATCAAGRCGAVCAEGFGDCDGNPANGCEARLTSDPSRCGTCATVCAGGTNARAICAAGFCRQECAPGFADCDGNATNGCESSLDGTASCGRCGNLCSGATPLCAMAPTGFACASGCSAAESRCPAGCANLQTDVTDCGACGNACPAVANAARTCAAGRCGFACNPGFGDCDGNPANGCEVFLGTDPSHCGSCGRACAGGPNATGVCAAGSCALRCATSFGDCDGNPANGCEVDVRSAVTHCGVCGRACPGGPNAAPVCTLSVCDVTCNPGFADCDGNPANGCEINTQTSPTHCGACGTLCPSGVCAAGRCGSLATCQSIRETLPAATSGVYTIDPDGPGGAAPLNAYCDLATDGGGWTLVAYASRGSVTALSTDTGIRNLYSLATGGGTYDGLNRRGVASLAAVPIARRSREMLLARADADFFTGPIAGYDVATKFTIPSPSTVNFLNSNPAVALADRGPCVPVLITTLRGPNATGAMRYVFQNTLSVSWTDTYPTSYGVMDTSSCYNGSLGPNYVSDYTGVGNLRSYPWPRAPDGAAHTYWHLGWWDATRTSQTGSVAIWLR